MNEKIQDKHIKAVERKTLLLEACIRICAISIKHVPPKNASMDHYQEKFGKKSELWTIEKNVKARRRRSEEMPRRRDVHST